MKLIEQSIRFPVSTAVGVILLVLFGTISLFRLPVQLTPNVEEAEITVITVWPGASPQEVEREIVLEQEDQLKSLQGLVKMESQSSSSSSTIVLKFEVGTNIDSALVAVGNRLEQVPEYPADAEKPLIRTVDPDSNAAAWFVLKTAEENPFTGDLWTLFDFVDDVIKPDFERVPGIAASGVFGGREREVRVTLDPAALVAHGVTIAELRAAIDNENRNYSGGDFDEGKRRYVVRTIGEYRSMEEIENIVVATRNNVPIYLRDVAAVTLDFRKPTIQVFNRGDSVIAINATKEPGANVLDAMAGLKETQRRLNEGRLKTMGLELEIAYDETVYIESAISLVKQSLLVGGLLAIITLLLYLRSASSTLIIAIAIPISVVGSFIGMNAFGRTLNVISLAGMAFAVGMVVDNSIVVLENIYRHRQMGKSRFDAALEGTKEVWGAVLASTATTIAVFLPVVFIQEEVGQLFGDIAMAISFAVALSLVVSITVIPSLAAKIIGSNKSAKTKPKNDGSKTFAQRSTEAVGNLVYRITGSTATRLALVLGFTVAAIGISYLLIPDREYLPQGNQNFAFGRLLPPPGYSLNEMVAMESEISKELSPLWASDDAALAGGGIDQYFFVALNGFAFAGVSANDPARVQEITPEFQRATANLPGTIAFMTQASIFERGLGDGGSVDIEITGPELEQLIAIGNQIFGEVMQKLRGAQAIPIPSLDLGNPEVQVTTDRLRAASVGLSNRELGYAVSVLVDGAKASEYQHEGREIDIRLVAESDGQHTHLLEQLPIATPRGGLVTIGSVAKVESVNGPVQINHSERERTITIQVQPEASVALESAMQIIENDILQPMRANGQLTAPYNVRLSGAASKLVETLTTIRWDLALALVITFLLLSALFESFLYPLVIMFGVPLAGMGGFIGLAIINALYGQKLDVLTMMGFIILIGTVVNNAILIVHQSLNHIREGMPHREAIREAVTNRMRPIFMSVSTSVLGMAPLVLFPGAGSELYRGLGSVVIGGLIVSTLFTLILVPALFSLMLDLRGMLGRSGANAAS
jgi:HAE1 family hydrophobic/amphiphilic exporter-1